MFTRGSYPVFLIEDYQSYKVAVNDTGQSGNEIINELRKRRSITIYRDVYRVNFFRKTIFCFNKIHQST